MERISGLADFVLILLPTVITVVLSYLSLLFFGAKEAEALYSQQKQDWELTVAQIMNSLLPNSDLN